MIEDHVSASKRRVRANLCHAFDRRCAYCNTPTPLREGTIDHYLPQALGGRDEWQNLRWSCKPCNVRKADMHPDEWNATPPKRFVEAVSRFENRVRLLVLIARRRIDRERGRA